MVDIRDTLAGVVGSACAVAIGQPFDTVKLRIVSATSSEGPVATMRRMFANEGIRSMWKGAVPALSSQIVENSTLWTLNGLIRRVVAVAGTQEKNLSSVQHGLIGGVSGIVSGTAIAPFDLMKCRLQYQKSTAAGGTLYSGMLDCARQIYRETGIRGFFDGWKPVMMRDVPFNIFFFGLFRGYCSMFQWFRGPETTYGDLSGYELFFAGGLAGASTWGIVYPTEAITCNAMIATVRAQVSGHGPSSTTSTSTSTSTPTPHRAPLVREIVRELYSQGGVRAFYRGWSAAVLRALPANAALFGGAEVSLRLLKGRHASDEDENDF